MVLYFIASFKNVEESHKTTLILSLFFFRIKVLFLNALQFIIYVALITLQEKLQTSATKYRM